MALGHLQGFCSAGSAGVNRSGLLRTGAAAPSAALRRNQGSRPLQTLCCLGDFTGPSEGGDVHSSKIPDPIDEEWKMVRQRWNALDAGAPSTSGREQNPFPAPFPYPQNPAGRPGSHNQFSFTDDSWDLTDDGGYTPFPANLPTGGLEGAQGMELGGLAKSAGLHLSESKEIWGKLGPVFVLLFGVGQEQTEGIYSLRAMRRDTGLPQDTIIAFEDLEDAQRYGIMLQSTMPHVASVMPILPHELLEFCKDAGYNCRLEPRGSWFSPPNFNVGMTDWERSLRLREGQWSVLERDPDRQPLPEVPPALPPQMPYGRYHNNAGAYFSMDYELEELKARLERLLPDE